MLGLEYLTGGAEQVHFLQWHGQQGVQRVSQRKGELVKWWKHTSGLHGCEDNFECDAQDPA